LRLSEFLDNQHLKVARLSAQSTGRLYSPENTPRTNLCYRLSRPQGHSAAGRIHSTRNRNKPIGNRTRNLPACSEVPQPTAPPSTPDILLDRFKYIIMCSFLLYFTPSCTIVFMVSATCNFTRSIFPPSYGLGLWSVEWQDDWWLLNYKWREEKPLCPIEALTRQMFGRPKGIILRTLSGVLSEMRNRTLPHTILFSFIAKPYT
jgi:hypothetical protein